jgi:hypothetical protein
MHLPAREASNDSVRTEISERFRDWRKTVVHLELFSFLYWDKDASTPKIVLKNRHFCDSCSKSDFMRKYNNIPAQDYESQSFKNAHAPLFEAVFRPGGSKI